jgi:uncharacterized membrane-anchored protein YitT (DUF2179 family)
MSKFKDQFVCSYFMKGIVGGIIYSVFIAIALNVFWEPAGMFSGGLTGIAQIFATAVRRMTHGNNAMSIVFSTGTFITILNIPLIYLAWRYIGHQFTVLTMIAVFTSTVVIQLLSFLRPISSDPMLNALFGAFFSGIGSGIALRFNISSGGLDIVALLLRKRADVGVGTMSVFINIFIVAVAVLFYGWQNALYSAIAIVVNGALMDKLYSKQRKFQVFIVTDYPERVTRSIQADLHHGITIFQNVRGAYSDTGKMALFVVISQNEFGKLKLAILEGDKHAFASVTTVDTIVGTYMEPLTK